MRNTTPARSALVDEIDLPLFKKGHNEGRPKAAICPACHNTVVARHCKDSKTCNWFVCKNHSAVIGIIGPRHTFWLAKPQQG